MFKHNDKTVVTCVRDEPLSSWARRDKRSVAAMLRGTGDGRERNYEIFVKAVHMKNPALSLEEIDVAYSKHIRVVERRWEEHAIKQTAISRTTLQVVCTRIISHFVVLNKPLRRRIASLRNFRTGRIG